MLWTYTWIIQQRWSLFVHILCGLLPYRCNPIYKKCKLPFGSSTLLITYWNASGQWAFLYSKCVYLATVRDYSIDSLKCHTTSRRGFHKSLFTFMSHDDLIFESSFSDLRQWCCFTSTILSIHYTLNVIWIVMVYIMSRSNLTIMPCHVIPWYVHGLLI